MVEYIRGYFYDNRAENITQSSTSLLKYEIEKAINTMEDRKLLVGIKFLRKW